MKDTIVIGNLSMPEFEQAREWLVESGSYIFVDSIDCLSRSNRLVESPPRLIVVAESFRGQFSDPSIERLRHEFPLAQFVNLVGSWCEGETRSGTPLPNMNRIYAAEFVTRLRRLNDPATLARSLLPTLSDHERQLQHATVESTKVNALVICHDLNFGEAIADMIDVTGGAAIATRINADVCIPSVNVIVYDAHPNHDQRAEDLERILHWRLPIIGVVDFPRGYEIEQLKKMGVDAVLPKPFAIDDLVFQLNEACRTCETAKQQLSATESAA